MLVFCPCLAHHKLVAVLFVPWYYHSQRASKVGMALELSVALLTIRLSPICLHSIGHSESVTTAAISFFYRRHRLRFLFEHYSPSLNTNRSCRKSVPLPTNFMTCLRARNLALNYNTFRRLSSGCGTRI